MPNSIGPTGLTTATQAELLANYTTNFQTIYGSGINLSSDTPDGQLINDFIQSVVDIEDLLTQVNAQFDPNQAVGILLDQRCAINGVIRKGGTYTTTDVSVITTRSVNLFGLDQTVNPVYTLSDNAGNLWQLVTTQLAVSTGTNSFLFQAQNSGAVLTTPNTITTQVTIVLGVASVNNPATYITLGVNQESDANLRLRRAQSVALSSQGYLVGLLGNLENLPGITFAQVYENNTGTTDGDGVPGHSIWVIVAGTATDQAIATVIYQQRNAGAGMYGQTSYTLTQINGTNFTVFWDFVTEEALYIQFTATSINGTSQPNLAAILAGLPTSFVPGVYQEVNINALATAVQAIDPNTLVTNAGFSTSLGGSYTDTLTPTSKNYQFQVTAANIVITPMILSPTSSSVVTLMTEQFTALGGYAPFTYSITTNNSGGSVNSSTGLYTAGSTTGVSDTLSVSDSLSHSATATVLVTS